MTVRHALLPLGAVLVLGLGIYLFIAVRALSSPGDSPRPARTPPPASARAQQPAASSNAGNAASAPQRPARTDAAPPLRAPPPVVQEPPAPLSGPRLDADMDEANKAYDRGDYEDAKQVAGRVLAQQPTNVRMLRIIVSASCIDGDAVAAQSYYARLPAADQEQMRARCARYGVSFGDR